MKNSLATKPKRLVKYGDLYALGSHRLLCSSSTDETSVQRLLIGVKIKSIITDPPYGVAYVEAKAGFKQNIANPHTIMNDHKQSDSEYELFSYQWLHAIQPYLDKKNSVYVFNSDRMIFALREAMKKSNYHFAQLLIWIKTQPVIGRLDYLPQHELLAYGWYGTHEFLKAKDKSVLFYPKPSKSTLHPTMKPVGLIRNLILNNTRVGDMVYDPFGGSGTTLIAAEQTKRTCYMMEISEVHCQTIIDRYEKITHLKAKLL